jgi:hypothetical protein
MVSAQNIPSEQKISTFKNFKTPWAERNARKTIVSIPRKNAPKKQINGVYAQNIKRIFIISSFIF